MKRKDILYLLLLTLLCLLVHGYHPTAEDAETYLPGVEKLLNPGLFPVGAEYFRLHAHLTLFPDLIAASVRLSHLPLPWVLFAWQCASIFLFLAASLALARRIFPDPCARWSGVLTLAALLTLPVAGTALYILDQYINPRNLVAFAVVFAVVRVLDRKYLSAALFLVFAAAVHPFMSVFAISFCLLVVILDRFALGVRSSALPAPPITARAALLGLPIDLFAAPTEAYRSVAAAHRYQFLVQWTWYELLGAVAPLFILSAVRRWARRSRLRNLDVLCCALVIFGAFYFAAGLVVSIPARLAVLARLQPMRSFYILYVLLFLILGGLLGRFVLRAQAWRWVLLFAPLCFGMYRAQRLLFPASAHVEWPWAAPRNAWVQAFAWARDHTSPLAIFAIDPDYMALPGEDANGFRAVAERSQLADAGKDSGVVEMFPQIGDQWQAEVRAQTGLDAFETPALHRLQSTYHATWAVLRLPLRNTLECPYENKVVAVCRLPE